VAKETVMPKTDTPARKIPAYLATARALYADAFEHRRKKDVAAAMDEWSELDEGEQGFTIAHLLFLNLKAQAETLRVLGDVRDLLDEVADGLDQALDEDDDEPEEEHPVDLPGDSDPVGVRVDDAPVVDTATPSDPAAAPAEGA
jgi:hypothetical protein